MKMPSMAVLLGQRHLQRRDRHRVAGVNDTRAVERGNVRHSLPATPQPATEACDSTTSVSEAEMLSAVGFDPAQLKNIDYSPVYLLRWVMTVDRLRELAGALRNADGAVSSEALLAIARLRLELLMLTAAPTVPRSVVRHLFASDRPSALEVLRNNALRNGRDHVLQTN